MFRAVKNTPKKYVVDMLAVQPHFLKNFLQHYQRKGVINFYQNHADGYPFQVPDTSKPGNDVAIIVEFKQTLIGRPKNKDGKYFINYSVLDLFKDQANGKSGSFGVRILGTLAEQYNNRYVFETHKKRFMKIIAHTEFERLGNIGINEVASCRLFSLKVKDCRFDKNKSLVRIIDGKEIKLKGLCFLEMQLLPGVDLFSVIDSEYYHNAKPVLVLQRLQIIINILREIKTKLHDKGYVHRDLKPENLLICLETNRVSIIDGEFVVPETKAYLRNNEGFRVGTLEYWAPEIFRMNTIDAFYTKKAEIYTIGMIISEFCGAKPRYSIGHFKSPAEALIAYQNKIKENKEPAPIKETLLKNETKLTAEQREALRKVILDDLLAFDPAQRGELAKAIDDVEKIKLEVKKKGLTKTPAEANFIQAAHDKAITLIGKCFKQEELIQLIRDLPDFQPAIDEFIETIGIVSLRGLSRLSAMARVNALYQDFECNTKALTTLCVELEKNICEFHEPILKNFFQNISMEAQQDLQRAQYLKGKIDNYKLQSLDTLQQFNVCVEVRIEYLTAQIKNGLFHRSKLSSLYQLYKNINPLLKPNNDGSLHDRIKFALSEYIAETLTTKNISTADKAASERRCKDMYDILDRVHAIPDPDGLRIVLIAKLKTMKKGYLSSSLLESKIMSVLNSEFTVSRSPVHK